VTRPTVGPPQVVPELEAGENLLDHLARVLETSVAGVVARPHQAATTAALQLLEVATCDGRTFHLVGKTLPATDTSRPGPENLWDTHREPWVYEHVLAPIRCGPRYYGTVVSSTGSVLLLERVDGAQLRYTAEAGHWGAAGEWLGRFHRSAGLPADSSPLLRLDEAWWSRLFTRARSFHGDAALCLGDAEQLLEHSKSCGVGDEVVVHGDYHAANILIDKGSVVPVDWELCSIGDRFHDLAALVSGALPAGLRAAALDGYAAGSGVACDEEFSYRLALAELRSAVQWLGWDAPTRWRPPRGQRTDWAGEVRRHIEHVEALGRRR
jgi:hypothetical protein